ncbi:hypothetical protein GCM10029978_011650 [Actinoallomurus acanthiterrae]
MSFGSPDPTTVAILTYRFPGVSLWFGETTGSWWALVRVSRGWRLVEAADVEELTRAIIQAESWPRPSAVRGDLETTRWDCPVVGRVPR